MHGHMYIKKKYIYKTCSKWSPFCPLTSTVQILNVNGYKSTANLPYCDAFRPIFYEINQSTTKIPSNTNFG